MPNNLNTRFPNGVTNSIEMKAFVRDVWEKIRAMDETIRPEKVVLSGGGALSLSNIAARQEVRDLVNALKLPGVRADF